MTDFIEGKNRFQATLFPEQLDDYIAEDNSVRVIDVFIDGIDLSGMGFKTVPEILGRPAYHPATMLKLYVYGYLNRVLSTRRLEREAGRNVELMWLLGRLVPDFKTIADFRKDNTKAVRLVCREFVMICRKLDLFSEAFVAIDGSKFKAVNNRDRNFTRARLKRRLEDIDKNIDRYLAQIESADQLEASIAKSKTEKLENKITKLRTNKQAAALVGVAPINKESGSYTGKSKIRGGRHQVRTAMFMAMMSAMQCNPVFKEMHQRLLAKGKPKKTAIIACVRKMIVILNSMVRNGVYWNPEMGK